MQRWWLVVVVALVMAFGAITLAFTIGKTNVPLVDLKGLDVTKSNSQKHSIPLEEIVSGGPSKDGIPSIDTPKFVSVPDANQFLADSEPGMVYETSHTSRFYPFQILVWHEIVNDSVDGQRVLVTYCPLCRSGIVFDPLVNGERVEFGTSGKLWNSNLLMYDRKTDSYWSQILGEAVVGEMTGTKLTVLPSDITPYRAWKAAHPSGEVLSRETGYRRDYGRDPYGDYYTTTGTYFPVKHQDTRLAEKEMVLGLELDGKFKAYPLAVIKQAGRIEDQFAGRTIVGVSEADGDTVRLFEKKSDGQLNRLAPITAFWFSWAASHPRTEVYQS